MNHRVEISTVDEYFQAYLGLEANQCVGVTDWLVTPCQKLRSLTVGGIFRDDLGLGAACRRLKWYPHDVWLYLLASCWARIGQEEHLMGRAGWAGDEIGSAVIAARLVRDVMRLSFFMERRYPPYAKWLGTAFAELDCAGALQPVLASVLQSSSWEERGGGIASAYRILAEMHNELGLTPVLPTDPSPFWGRPFRVIHGDRFASALRDAIQDDEVAALAARGLIGNIDLISDNTDLLEDPARCGALRAVF